MTPAARLSAAIEILDHILDGVAAEKALTNWARGSRYAGSKDRAAVRDHVFDALRCKRSYACLGGAETGRGIVLGLLCSHDIPPQDMFSGEGYAPGLMTAEEVAHDKAPEGSVALDIPDWIAPQMQASLGKDFALTCKALQTRAPVFLRVNSLKSSRDQAIVALAKDDILTQPHPLSPTALEVIQNPRRVHLSAPYIDGHVELQDAASQAVTDLLPIKPDSRVLDYCAGGGGKVLAMAARVCAQYYAHDIDSQRMNDLPARADRAGMQITLLDTDALATQPPFDLVLCDAPCSGSGAWRRSPAGKWGLTKEKLTDLMQIQAAILQEAAKLVAPDGVLAYTTCSLLDAENSKQVDTFLKTNKNWIRSAQNSFTPLAGGDGFFCAHLTRK